MAPLATITDIILYFIIIDNFRRNIRVISYTLFLFFYLYYFFSRFDLYFFNFFPQCLHKYTFTNAFFVSLCSLYFIFTSNGFKCFVRSQEIFPQIVYPFPFSISLSKHHLSPIFPFLLRYNSSFP